MKVILTLKKLLILVWRASNNQNRLRLIQLFFLVILGSILDLTAVASIVPLIRSLEDLQTSSEYSLPFGITINLSPDNIVVFSGFFILFVALSVFLRLYIIKTQNYTSASIGSFISSSIFERIIDSPLLSLDKIYTKDLIAATTLHIGYTVVSINQLFSIVSSALTIFLLSLAVFLYTPVIAIASLGTILLSYLLIGKWKKFTLVSNSNRIADLASFQIEYVTNALMFPRDIQIFNLSSKYKKDFDDIDKPMRSMQAQNVYLSVFPKQLIEGIGIISILGFTLLSSKNDIDILPTISVLAYGAQKLLPASQQIYFAWSTIAARSASTQRIIDLNQELKLSTYSSETSTPSTFRSIVLEDIVFSHGNKRLFSNINLSIKSSDKVVICGESGQGKSTLIDILMGFFRPTSGKVLLNNVDVYSLGRNGSKILQSICSYSSQNSNMLNKSILENITFESSFDNVDLQRYELAIQTAQLSTLIDSLPNNHFYNVGELGARLSGGQRQRISLARALYRSCSVIYLDEPTSSLDSETEKAFARDLFANYSSNTIVIITHSPNIFAQYATKLLNIENSNLQITSFDR